MGHLAFGQAATQPKGGGVYSGDSSRRKALTVVHYWLPERRAYSGPLGGLGWVVMGLRPPSLAFLAFILGLISAKNRVRKNYTCAASRNTTDRIMVIRAKHTTIV